MAPALLVALRGAARRTAPSRVPAFCCQHLHPPCNSAATRSAARIAGPRLPPATPDPALGLPLPRVQGRRPAHVLSCAPAPLGGAIPQQSRTHNECAAFRTANETRDAYLTKYREKLERKAEAEGLDSVQELFLRARQADQGGNQGSEVASNRRNANRAAGQTCSASRPLTTPAVKALRDILNLDKVRSSNLSPEEIGKLWTTYHTSKPNLLSAVIPVETYNAIMSNAKEFPMFVLPVPSLSGSGYELYFLEWRFNSCILTSLAEYKGVGPDAARPHLTLTHYTELAKDRGIVLMRGEITEGPTNGREAGLVSMAGAHLLAMLVQDFYGVTGGPRKKALLETFHRRPTEFTVDELVDAVNSLDRQ